MYPLCLPIDSMTGLFQHLIHTNDVCHFDIKHQCTHWPARRAQTFESILSLLCGLDNALLSPLSYCRIPIGRTSISRVLPMQLPLQQLTTSPADRITFGAKYKRCQTQTTQNTETR